MALPMVSLYSWSVTGTTARATWAAPPTGAKTRIMLMTYPHPNGPWQEGSPVDYSGTSATWSVSWNTAYEIALAYVSATDASPDWTTSSVEGPGPQQPQSVNYQADGKNITITYTPGIGADQTEYDRHGDGTVELTNYPSGTFQSTFDAYNTYYDIWVRSYDVDWGLYSAWKVLTVKTGPDTSSSPPPIPASAPSILSRVDKGYYVTWGSSAGATSYDLRIRVEGYSDYGFYTNLTEAYLFNTGTYGNRYWWSVKANNQYGSSAYTSESGLVVQPAKPSITGISSPSGITITCNYAGYGTATVYGYRTYTDAPLTPQTCSSGGSVTFTGLEPGVQYYFKAIVSSYGVDSPQSDVIYVTYVFEFSWDTPKVKGETFEFTPEEWNKFTTAINQRRQIKGLSTITFADAHGIKFSATMFNLAVNSIVAMSPTIAPPPTIADPQPTDFNQRARITADRLNGLVSSLNSIT
jgi:hypothetical protein